MKFYSSHKDYELTNELQDALNNIRKARNFNPKSYVDDKVKKIIKYMEEYKLDACVVALSGGIDSALVYKLLKVAEKEKNSPIKKVIPLFLPVYKSKGATNQESAKKRVDALVDTENEKVIEIDISEAHSLLRKTVNDAMGFEGKPWADGQLVSYLRTPTYYYVTSLLSQEGYKPVFFGTTNKDEGAYLGYFGKASDGMVDVQLISDIHKSEVYETSKYLGVVDTIMEAVPTGDMYDNRSDEELFGAPYDFVELYLHFLEINGVEKVRLVDKFSEQSKDQFLKLKKNLDELHNYNKHKYLGCSPSVHLDIYESRFNGGWKYFVYNYLGEV